MSETEQRIAEIKARAEAATEGPWEWDRCYEMQEKHWALVSPASRAEGRVVDSSLVLLLSRWKYLHKPADQQPNWQFLARARADIPWLLEEHARLTAELREAKQAAEAARTERNRIGLEVRRELLATAATQRKRAEAAEAEVERLRTLVDAIVTGDGEARGIGEGLRQAAVFVKGWCRCLDYYKAQGAQDPLCVACELAAELAGRAEEVEAPDGS